MRPRIQAVAGALIDKVEAQLMPSFRVLHSSCFVGPGLS
jgi:hypothetical protein